MSSEKSAFDAELKALEEFQKVNLLLPRRLAMLRPVSALPTRAPTIPFRRGGQQARNDSGSVPFRYHG